MKKHSYIGGSLYAKQVETLKKHGNNANWFVHNYRYIQRDRFIKKQDNETLVIATYVRQLLPKIIELRHVFVISIANSEFICQNTLTEYSNPGWTYRQWLISSYTALLKSPSWAETKRNWSLNKHIDNIV
jgi:hypothetical protein